MTDDDSIPSASPILRAWPAAAGLVGVLGLAIADDFTTFALAGLLVLGGLALELAGWAEGIRLHAPRLRRAAILGALAGAAIVGMHELRRSPAATDDGHVALR